jgi:hypothetical protein
MNIDINEFIKKYRTSYKHLKPAYSKALKLDVNFNAEGFNHLLFKGNKKRTDRVVFNRLPLVPLIVPVIKNCDKVLGLRKKDEIQKGKTAKVTYYSLEAIVGQSKTRVRVVVRKIGRNGQLHFYSIMKYN